MLKSLVSQRSSASNEHIEAVTAERDFFREKYAAQMNEMEHLKGQLKESQRVIDRLRKQVLELSMGAGDCSAAIAAGGSTKKEKASVSGSSNTSLTSMTYGDEESIRSSPCSVADCLQASPVGSPVGEDSSTPHEPSIDANDIIKEQSTDEAEEDVTPTHDEPELEEDESEAKDADEAADIRANAERMLQWANYQSTRRSMLSPSATPSIKDDGAFVYDVTETNQSTDTYDDSFSASPARNEKMNETSKQKNGRMSKLLSNLKDFVDPPFEDESDLDEESSDDESILSIEHRSFDE
jgi:hypothetical protein